MASLGHTYHTLTRTMAAERSEGPSVIFVPFSESLGMCTGLLAGRARVRGSSIIYQIHSLGSIRLIADFSCKCLVHLGSCDIHVPAQKPNMPRLRRRKYALQRPERSRPIVCVCTIYHSRYILVRQPLFTPTEYSRSPISSYEHEVCLSPSYHERNLCLCFALESA